MRNFARRLREAKGPRAFGFEVGVVVVGVLIALSAQQLVDDWSWHRRVVSGEQALVGEARDTSWYLAEQIVTAPCVQAQIAEARRRVLEASDRLEPLPTFDTVGGPVVIRAPSRLFNQDAWAALLGDGTVSHMDDRTALLSAGHYEQLRILRDDVSLTLALRQRLLVLGEPLPLNAGVRYELLRDLAQLRSLSAFQTLVAAQLLVSLRDLGRLRPAAEIDQQFVNALQQDGTYTWCRANKLPLGDWKGALASVPPEPR